MNIMVKLHPRDKPLSPVQPAFLRGYMRARREASGKVRARLDGLEELKSDVTALGDEGICIVNFERTARVERDDDAWLQ
jgi:hypothetical protein